MSKLHQIDKPYGGYLLKELEEFMVFCILDTACTYKMVCNTFNELRAHDMTTRKGIKNHSEKEIVAILRWAGYRFPVQHASRIKAFGDNKINLKTATRYELVKNVNGIGLKLASFFLRNTRDEDYAVLDVHTLRYVDEMVKKMKPNPIPRTYEQKEIFFRGIAQSQGKSTMELDLQIWNDRRVGNEL